MFPYLLLSALTLLFSQRLKSQNTLKMAAPISSSKGIKDNHIYYTFVFLTWVLIYTFKGTTGTDSWGYWHNFKELSISQVGIVSYMSQFRDFLYQGVTWVICKITNGKWIGACFFFAVLLYSPILYLISKKSINPCFSCIMYIFYMNYFFGYNGLRQGLSMGFAVIAFYFFLAEKKFKLYMLFMFIAYGFHSAAMFAIPLHFILLQNIRSTKSFFIVLGFLLTFLFLSQLWGGFMGALDMVGQEKMVSDYGNLAHYDTGRKGSILRLLVIGSVLYVAASRYRTLKSFFPEYDRDLWVVIIGFLMTLLMYRFVYFARVSAYIMIGMPLVFPKLTYAYGLRNRKIMMLGMGTVFFFYMISLLLHGESDLYPYVPVWVSERY